ncbi:MAG TPA: gamma-glutamylcyclotransferase [Anaerolineae bacterium]|nr:gamma-glutamylcyclotransferase [Anaerolineae bacterium]
MNQSESEILPFFVYGTLLPGQPNYALWAGAIVAEERAWLEHGRLYDASAYPMLVEMGEDSVQGILITVDPDQYPAVLARLDWLEGYKPDKPEQSDYRRVAREVCLADGRTAQAWVYIGKIQYISALPIIPNGDWAAYVQNKQETIDRWWETIDSVAGRHKM